MFSTGAVIWLFATFQTLTAATQDHAQVTCGLLRIQAQTELTNRRLLDQQMFNLNGKNTPVERERRAQLERDLSDTTESLAKLKKTLVERGCL